MIIFQILLTLYLTLSTLAFIFIVFTDRLLPPAEEPPKYYLIILVGAFIALMLILWEGFKEYLVFIPYSWGSYGEDGDWNSMRSSVAILLSLITSGYFFHLIWEVRKKERVIQKLQLNKKQEKGQNRSFDTSSAVNCPYCNSPMPEDTNYDSEATCPKCGKEFDIHGI